MQAHDSLLAEYISHQEEGLDAIDIQDVMEDNFGFDEELDDPKDIKRKKLAKKLSLIHISEPTRPY